MLASLVRRDLTGSMGGGWYLIVGFADQQRGQIVTACIPKVRIAYGIKRNYIDNQNCHEGHVLMKRTAAKAGDSIRIQSRELYINEQHMPGYRLSCVDALHRELPCADRNYIVPPQQLFLLGDAKHKSWDSRYWGPVTGGYRLMKIL